MRTRLPSRATARGLAIATALVACVAAPALAQRDTSTSAPATAADSGGSLACAARGITIGASASGPGAGSTSPTTARARAGAALDTVITLAIADRTWTRDSVDAGVSLGLGGTAGARRAPWHACAGVSAHLGTVTAHLHEVRGRIHFRADPSALDSIGRASGSTPPAAPPRR
jgi:hypothetical protein